MEPQKVKSLITCPVCKGAYVLAHQASKTHTVRPCNRPGCGAILDIYFRPDQPTLVERISVVEPAAESPKPPVTPLTPGTPKIVAAGSDDKTQYISFDTDTNTPDSAVPTALAEPEYKGDMMLVGKAGMFGLGRQEYSLKKGNNIVGRLLTDDIVVKGDDTVSRSSINLEVVYNQYAGYRCRMHVLNAKNPVLHNGLPVSVGTTVEIASDDTIVLGHTKYTFIKK